VRAELADLLAAVERARDDLREVAVAQQAVAATRQAIEAVVRRAADADRLAVRTEQHLGTIAEAERRVVRVDKLLSEARTALERLQSEKLQLDRAAEHGARLAMQLRQAEGLVVALQKERELAERLRDALAAARRV
jgi:Mg2+ and Co2+ transporter CorA